VTLHLGHHLSIISRRPFSLVFFLNDPCGGVVSHQTLKRLCFHWSCAPDFCVEHISLFPLLTTRQSPPHRHRWYHRGRIVALAGNSSSLHTAVVVCRSMSPLLQPGAVEECEWLITYPVFFPGILLFFSRHPVRLCLDWEGLNRWQLWTVSRRQRHKTWKMCAPRGQSVPTGWNAFFWC